MSNALETILYSKLPPRIYAQLKRVRLEEKTFGDKFKRLEVLLEQTTDGQERLGYVLVEGRREGGYIASEPPRTVPEKYHFFQDFKTVVEALNQADSIEEQATIATEPPAAP